VFIGGGVESMTRAPYVMGKPEVAWDRGPRELPPDVAGPEGDLDDAHIRPSRSDAVADPGEVPGDSRRMCCREDDPRPDGHERADEEAEADQHRAQRDQWAHLWCMSGAR